MTPKIDRKTCYWCGAPKVSDEHVPPQNLFPAGAAVNLITVPACRKHNEAFHMLDERFRVFLQGASRSELAVALFADKTIRGLKRRPGLIKSLLRSAAPAKLDGSPTLAVNIANEHHDLYFEKIARALYFRHYGQTYAGELRSSCSHFSGNVDFREMILLYHSVKSSLQPGLVTDDRVFRYEIGRVIEPGGEAFFLHLSFYTDLTVFCVGTPMPSLPARIWRAGRKFGRQLRRKFERSKKT